jgi:hypothetical protein
MGWEINRVNKYIIFIGLMKFFWKESIICIIARFSKYSRISSDNLKPWTNFDFNRIFQEKVNRIRSINLLLKKWKKLLMIIL